MQNKPHTTQGEAFCGLKTSDATSLRKFYKTPTLTKYGSVTDLTQGGATGVPEGGSSVQKKAPSDFRLKENINYIGQHPLGFGLYLFDYKPVHRDAYGHSRQFGVMAQEVEPVVPAAISLNSDGFKVVDYSLLGINHPLH